MESPSGIHAVAQKLLDQMCLAPETGQIMLFDQRMLLIHGFSMAALRKELIERLGSDMARRIFTRLGYQQGLEDYKSISGQFGDAVETAVDLGPGFRALQGFYKATPLEFNFDVAQGEFFGEFTAANSWEAEGHLKHLGPSGAPVCWMSVGYATAYITSFFGKPVLVREVECVAMGHAQCRIIIKPLKDWENVEDDLRFFQVEEFVDLPIKRDSGKLAGNPASSAEETSPLSNELVGASTAFNSVAYLLKRVSQTDATVLFLGESGVGKERFSRTLHEIGPRASEPFVSINCAAIPHELVESELFGIEKGAFTGATSSRKGRFERAHKGTLFLDEIGSLPFHAQGKLLRALQEREIERVGGTEVRPVDVRVIAATNEDLRKAVEEGRFRADLFFRLNVFPIRIPSLRERREDIPLMLNVFVERFSERFSKKINGITRKALDALWHYDWPGNVRELENMVERSVILCDDDGTIDIHHLFSDGEHIDIHPLDVSPWGTPQDSSAEGNLAVRDTPRDLINRLLDQGQSFAQIEQSVLECALERNQGKLAGAARELQIGRGQMQYRVSKLPSRTGKQSSKR